MSDGHDCRCGAKWRGECGCGADWTPQEVIDLRAEVETLTRERNELHCRLMARPRLAPEHVEALVALNDRLFGAGSVPTVGGQTVGHEIMRVILTGKERCTWMDAIRAALAALGEE